MGKIFAIRQPLSRSAFLIIGIASVVGLLVGYHFLSAHQHAVNPRDFTIPTWSQMWGGVVSMLRPDQKGSIPFFQDTIATGGRLFFGLSVGMALAIVVGVLMGAFAWLEAALVPPLSFLAKIPPTAAMAVFFALFGTDAKMFLAIIIFGVMPTLAQTVYLGMKEIHQDRIDKAHTLGASQIEILTMIMSPMVLPRVIDAVRLQIGPAMVYLIAAEMLVADEGFGYRIRLQRSNMSVVYPYLAMLSAFGFIMDRFMILMRKRLCGWYENGGN